MKITEKALTDSDLSELMQNDKVVGSLRREEDARVRHIFSKTRKLQRITELACEGDQLRADKVRQIKEQIEADQYQVDSKEVAKSIARSEVSRLLEKK
jgi:anti-sigma28 factor (negative regulator of flagellin synthesis)